MGQRASSMASPEEERMQKRIQQAIGTFLDFGEHVAQANQWARLCPTPKTCYLSFRMVINEQVSIEMLPYVWRIPGNVQVEVRKLRRRPELAPRALMATSWVSMRHSGGHDGPEDVIRPPKILSLRQFYYIYCFLSDIKSCAVHTVNFPEKTTSQSEDEDPEFDETECQICMDKQKQVALPCTHSFCLSCFQRWNAQSDSCPICRSKIECSEGSSLWQLTKLEVTDIGSYATDLVARIFEFLDQRECSTYSEEDVQRSIETYAEASAQKSAGIFNAPHAYHDMLPTILPLGIASLLGSARMSTAVDSDFVMALQLAAGEDQFAALRQVEQLQRDQTLANWMAMQLPRDDEHDEAVGVNDEPLYE